MQSFRKNGTTWCCYWPKILKAGCLFRQNFLKHFKPFKPFNLLDALCVNTIKIYKVLSEKRIQSSNIWSVLLIWIPSQPATIRTTPYETDPPPLHAGPVAQIGPRLFKHTAGCYPNNNQNSDQHIQFPRAGNHAERSIKKQLTTPPSRAAKDDDRPRPVRADLPWDPHHNRFDLL